MRFKRILLCTPVLPGRYGWPAAPYTATGYLSEFLKRNGFETDVIDIRLGYGLKEFKKKIEQFKPDLVGMTIMSYHRDIAYKLLEGIKSPDYNIIIGGPHVSTYRSKALEECVADFGVKLEGEFPLLELCKGVDLDKIKGLIYRDGDKIVENENREFIKDLDAIPFPRYEGFELNKYGRKEIFVVSSRGCPQQCIFCPIKVTVGSIWRSRSAESVVEEIKYLYDRGYRTLQFSDDNFSVNRERVFKICDLIEKNGLKGLSLNCPNGLRADRVDREMLKRMKDVGFQNICFGVESGSDRILKIIRKGEDVQTIENAIKIACELGFDVGLFFMVGHPGETPADVEESIKLALKYPVRNANFYNVIPFPGTELYEWVKKNNYFIKDERTYLDSSAHFDDPIFETPEFSAEERRIMLRKTAAIERLIRKRDTKRKLKRFGILKASADIVFSRPVYNGILKLQAENKYFKKVLIYLSKKFNLGYGL